MPEITEEAFTVAVIFMFVLGFFFGMVSLIFPRNKKHE